MEIYVRGMTMKKILYSDMDGTIINLTDVKHPRDKEMLHTLQEHGHLVAFNTGRNFQEALFCIQKFNFPYDYLVLNNGAHIVDSQGKEIFKKVIPGHVGKQIIEHCLTIPDLWIFFYNGVRTFGYLNGKTYEHGIHGSVLLPDYDFIEEYKKVLEFDIIAINQVDEGIDKLLEIQEYISNYFRNDAAGCLNVHYLDITAANCSKGSGVLALKELLGENLESYCIGDSFNDISMFEVSDHSYTFNHVHEDIYQHANKQVDFVYEVVEDMLK